MEQNLRTERGGFLVFSALSSSQIRLAVPLQGPTVMVPATLLESVHLKAAPLKATVRLASEFAAYSQSPPQPARSVRIAPTL